MKTLKIYYIDQVYVDYLYQFDKKVPFNKKQTRPYIGVVYNFHNQNYFAPLSSPKPKHLKMSNKAPDIFKIDNGLLGIVNINNMIPTPSECLTDVLSQIDDTRYRNLLIKQITYINDHKIDLLDKVHVFYTRYSKGFLPSQIMDRCCNFKLLEEKCNEWKL